MDNIIKLEAMKVDDGENTRIDCISCGGKNTLSISKKDGVVMWHCFRMMCNFKGTYFYGDKIRAKPKPKIDTYNKFTDPLWTLPNGIYIDYFGKYHISSKMLWDNNIKYSPEHDKIFVPYYSLLQTMLGYELRSWDGTVPKCLAYKLREGLVLYHVPLTSVDPRDSKLPTVLVEDFVSAMIVSQTKYPVISLCGSSISKGMYHILRSLNTQLILMLDGDAITKAMEIQQKFRGVLDLRICMLAETKKDPKDFTASQLESILELCDERV